MYCKNCGTQLNANQEVCLNCGVRNGVGTTYCASCGKQVAPNQAVCLNCGVALNAAAPGGAGYLNGKDKITMILICLFLGGIGIHNFMLGETKKGVVKIVASCLCGLGGILALIDLIKICMDKYTVDPNAFF